MKAVLVLSVLLLLVSCGDRVHQNDVPDLEARRDSVVNVIDSLKRDFGLEELSKEIDILERHSRIAELERERELLITHTNSENPIIVNLDKAIDSLKAL